MSTFVAEIIHNNETVPYTPGSAVSAGAVVVQGSLVGIAATDIAADEAGALVVGGVVEVPKPTGVGTDYSAGDLLYWDVADANAQDDADSGTNKRIGTAIADVATTETRVRVLLNQA
jgi:predicted RecA/RadA family phage recombinase